MKAEQPCLSCKRWERCYRLGPTATCPKMEAWKKRINEHHKRVGLS